jgi:hypothetical protein
MVGESYHDYFNSIHHIDNTTDPSSPSYSSSVSQSSTFSPMAQVVSKLSGIDLNDPKISERAAWINPVSKITEILGMPKNILPAESKYSPVSQMVSKISGIDLNKSVLGDRDVIGAIGDMAVAGIGKSFAEGMSGAIDKAWLASDQMKLNNLDRYIKNLQKGLYIKHGNWDAVVNDPNFTEGMLTAREMAANITHPNLTPKFGELDRVTHQEVYNPINIGRTSEVKHENFMEKLKNLKENVSSWNLTGEDYKRISKQAKNDYMYLKHQTGLEDKLEKIQQLNRLGEQ